MAVVLARAPRPGLFSAKPVRKTSFAFLGDRAAPPAGGAATGRASGWASPFYIDLVRRIMILAIRRGQPQT